MTAAVLFIVGLVFAWAVAPTRPKHTPSVQPRVSREDLETCARIAKRRFAELHGEAK